MDEEGREGKGQLLKSIQIYFFCTQRINQVESDSTVNKAISQSWCFSTVPRKRASTAVKKRKNESMYSPFLQLSY